MSGYARIHRSLIGHPAFRNDAEGMAFAWMILRASWKPVRVRYKGRAFVLERGQLAVSQRDMADALDRDKAWVERLWKRLKTEAMIQVAYEAGAAVITIANYNEYQAEADEREAPDEAAREAPNEADVRQARGTEQRREEGNTEELVGASPLPSKAADVRVALAAWNEAAGAVGWSKVVKFSPVRQAALRARLRDDGLDGWMAGIARARASPVLAAQPPPTWFGFDFIVKTNNFAKLIEGNYDRPFSSSGAASSGASTTRSAAATVFGPLAGQDAQPAPLAARRIGFAGG